MTDNAKPAPYKGWGEIRPQEKSSHYFVAGMSLCNKVGFFRGTILEDEPDDKCPICVTRLDVLNGTPGPSTPIEKPSTAKKPRAPKATK